MVPSSMMPPPRSLAYERVSDLGERHDQPCGSGPHTKGIRDGVQQRLRIVQVGGRESGCNGQDEHKAGSDIVVRVLTLS